MRSLDVIYTHWPRSIERVAYFVVTHQSLVKFLQPQGVKVNFYVVLQDELGSHRATSFICNNNIATVLKSSPPSLSSALNMAQTVGNSEFILFMQDDWMAQAPIHLGTILDHFATFPEHDMIKLIHRNEFGVDGPRHGPFMELDPNKRYYYYSDNPHIRRRSYLDHTGPFPDSLTGDGTDQGRCENAMNAIAKKLAISTGAHKILSVMTRNFVHIGDTHTTLTEKRFDR